MAICMRRVSGLRGSHAGDGLVGEGDDGGDDVAELRGEAVVKALFAPPCVPALLADSAVAVESVGERCQPRAAVTREIRRASC